MIRMNEVECPVCGGKLRYYDTVARGIREEYGIKTYISVRRLKCMDCKVVHREIPENVEPYKRYSSRLIFGILLGELKRSQIEYMDYPASVTIKRWFAIYTSSIVK